MTAPGDFDSVVGPDNLKTYRAKLADIPDIEETLKAVKKAKSLNDLPANALEALKRLAEETSSFLYG